MKKLLMVLLLAVLPFLSYASPARMERTDFCVAIGNLAGTAAQMKVMGMPQAEFTKALAELADAIKDFSKSDQAEIVAAAKAAYAKGGPPATRAQEAFSACLSKRAT